MTQQKPSSLDKLAPTEIVERMMRVASHLLKIMDNEAAVLKDCKPMQIVDFQDEKTRNTNELALLVSHVQKSPHVIDQVAAAKVASLKETMANLQIKSDQTAKMLLAAKSVSDNIVKELSAYATRKRAPQTGYGRTGSLEAAPKSSAMSLSLDASF